MIFKLEGDEQRAQVDAGPKNRIEKTKTAYIIMTLYSINNDKEKNGTVGKERILI